MRTRRYLKIGRATASCVVAPPFMIGPQSPLGGYFSRRGSIAWSAI